MIRMLCLSLLLCACNATETNVAPVPCGGDAGPCQGAFACASVTLDEGPSLPICVEERDCGGLACASGRCAVIPGDGDHIRCILVAPPDAGPADGP